MSTGICGVDIGSPVRPEVLRRRGRPPRARARRTLDRIPPRHDRRRRDVGHGGRRFESASDPLRAISTQWSPDGTWLAGQPESRGVRSGRRRGSTARGSGSWAGLQPGLVARPVIASRMRVHAEAGGSIRSVILADGTEETLVTATGGSQLGAPEWLADGRLLFVQDGNVCLFEPAMDAPVALTSVTSISFGPVGEPLAISPDGGWFAYTQSTDLEAVREDQRPCRSPGHAVSMDRSDHAAGLGAGGDAACRRLT